MKSVCVCATLFACLAYMPSYSQVGITHYRIRYDTIKNTLHIKQAYISDSLREHETLALSLYQMGLRKSIPLYNPYAQIYVEHSKFLWSNFNAIEDVAFSKGLCDNIIYFSFLDESYISAYAYVCVSGIFYYHPDQLGSATWITNSSRVPVEFIHYMPFGELWYNQQASAYNERFKFTGKERDTETGYDYFGARYYSSALPMWLSVDPLADKYPNISPYAYCHWNPVKYVDPDGKRIIVGSWRGRALAKLGFNNFEAKVQSQLQELKDMDPELNKMITKIEEADTEYHIISIDGNKFSYNDSEKEIRYNPDIKETNSGKKRPAQVGLAHELGHVENDVDGTTILYDEDKARHGDQTELDKWNKNELNSIDKENIVRENYDCKERPYNYFTREDY